MRLLFNTNSEAQAFCDKTHAALIATDPAYAKSVSDGQTLRWDAPRPELDLQEKPTGKWFVIVKDRCMGTLTVGERASVVLSVGESKV